jgi:hypothetical protein
MMAKENTPRHRKVPAVVAVVRPVARRLERMEALLIEMRHEQDVKLKRIGALERQIGELTEYIRASANRRPSRR